MVLMPDTTALRGARKAAAQLDLEADLLIEDWRQTCADVEYRCVYCEKAIASGNGSIDHFIPLSCSGGTTIMNCILSCRPCNLAKGDNSPEHFLVNNPNKLAHIRAYLTSAGRVRAFSPFGMWYLQEKRRNP